MNAIDGYPNGALEEMRTGEFSSGRVVAAFWKRDYPRLPASSQSGVDQNLLFVVRLATF